MEKTSPESLKKPNPEKMYVMELCPLNKQSFLTLHPKYLSGCATKKIQKGAITASFILLFKSGKQIFLQQLCPRLG